MYSTKLFICIKVLKNIIIILLAQAPEQEVGRFLSYEACKPEQAQKDLLIIVDFEPPLFFMSYQYFLTVVSKLIKASTTALGFEPTDTGLNYVDTKSTVMNFNLYRTKIAKVRVLANFPKLYVNIKSYIISKVEILQHSVSQPFLVMPHFSP